MGEIADDHLDRDNFQPCEFCGEIECDEDCPTMEEARISQAIDRAKDLRKYGEC